MQRYGNRLLGYWENKEAEERNASLSNGGLGLPSGDQLRQTQALASATSTGTGTDSTTKGEEERQAAPKSGEATPSQSQSHSQPQSETTTTDRVDRQFNPVASRTTSFDPATAQAPITTA
jgi:hypothetical protein